MEENDFESGSEQNPAVNDDNPFEMGLRNANSALDQHALLVLPRNSQFNKAEQPHSREEREVEINAQAHWSKRNSALKPGPNAAARAYSPVLSGRFSSHS